MLPRSQPYHSSISGDTHVGDFEDISTRTLQTVRVGQGAGKISSGTGNAFFGYDAGNTNAKGNYNAMMGFQAGAQNKDASFGTMVGAFAGAQNSRGSEVTFVGYRAGELNKDGSQLVGIGAYALRENVTGNGTVAIGYQSAERTLDGFYNTMIGTQSGQDNRSGNFNTMAGYRSGRSAFMGNENTYLGAFSGYSNQRGSGNSFIGYRCGEEVENGDFNVAIGAHALRNATYASCNIAIGPFAGANVNNNAQENVLIGAQVGTYASPSQSVLIGAFAGEVMHGAGSVMIGYASGAGQRFGDSNIFIGSGATSFNASNTLGIAIGSIDALTYTNAITIGNQVKNQRPFSILIGNDISSDANNSIILGKQNVIDSLIVFKDPISYILQESVFVDGKPKIGLCNTDYMNVLISPSNDIYMTGYMGIFASNTISSITNKPSGFIGPSTYDLRNYVSSHVIHHGIFHGIRTQNEYSEALTCNLHSSNAILSWSNTLLTSNTLALSNAQFQQDPSFTILLDTPSVINIREINATSAHIPIHIATRHVQPQPVVTNTTHTISAFPMNIYETTSILLSNLVFDVTCNIEQGVYVNTSNSIQYVLETPPRFGTLSTAITSNTSDIKYTLWPEHSFTSDDSFTVRPYYMIQGKYGIPSCNIIHANIQFDVPHSNLFYANTTFLAHERFIDSNMIFSYPQLASNVDVYVTSIHENLQLVDTYTSLTFTSNEIAHMLEIGLSNYPDADYTGYVDNTLLQINSILDDYASNLYSFSNVFYGIRDHAIMLSNVDTDIDSRILLEDIIAQTTIADITSPSSDTSNTLNGMYYKINEWSNIHDPDMSLFAPWTQAFVSSNEVWYQLYFQNDFYFTWSNTYAISNAFANNIDRITILENYHDSVVPRITFDTALSNNASAIYPYYSNIHQLYFEEKRLFLTYTDLQDGRLKITYADNPIYGKFHGLSLQIGTQNVDIHFKNGSNMFWDAVKLDTLTCNIYDIPFASNLKPITIDFTSYSNISETCILQHPENGLLRRGSNSNIVEYISFNPWSKEDHFHLLLKNTENKTVDYPVHIKYANGTQIQTLNAFHTHPLSNVVIGEYIRNDSRVMFSVSNIEIKTTQFDNQIEETYHVTPVDVYDPLIGYYHLSCNISISNVIQQTNLNDSNVYTCNVDILKDIYTFNIFTNAWDAQTESVQYVDSYSIPPIDSNVFGSNIHIWYDLHYVRSNTFAYTSNYYVYDREDVVIQYVNTLNEDVIYRHEQFDIIREPEIQLVTYPATSFNLYIDTSYLTVTCNIEERRPYVPLTYYHINTTTGSNITIYEPSNIWIVRSNEGPVSSFTLEDLDNRAILVAAETSNSSAIVTSKGALPVSVSHVPNANVYVQERTWTLSNSLDVMRIPLASVFAEYVSELDYNPSHVHIIDVMNGSLQHNSSNVATIFTWNQIDGIYYIPSGLYQSDIISFFYTDNHFVSDVYQVTLRIRHTPYSEGQTFNIGVNTKSIQNKLSSRLFYHTLENDLPYNNTTISITSINPSDGIYFTKNGVPISGVFTMQDVMSEIIDVYVTYPFEYGSIVYNVISIAESSTVLLNQSFPIRVVNHIAFPPLSLPPSLTIESIGYNGYTNRLTDYVESWLTSWMKDFETISASEIFIIVEQPPKYGMMTYIDERYSMIHEMQLQDILDHKIRYVSFDPEYINDDSMIVHISYNEFASPPLTMKCKTYVSHFYPYSIDTDRLDSSMVTPFLTESMQNDGLTWTTTCNIPTHDSSIVWSLNNTQYIWNVNTHPSTSFYEPRSVELSLTLDQADSISLSALSDTFPENTNYTVYAYVEVPPEHGVILNKNTGACITKFTSGDLTMSNIVYQNIGGTSQTDHFTIAFACSPYSLALTSANVSLIIRHLPKITHNTINYVYWDSLSDASNIYPFTLSFDVGGYVHAIGTCNIDILHTSSASNVATFFTLSSNEFGYRVHDTIIASDELPYPESQFTFTLNQSPSPYVNDLANFSIYKDIFIHTFTSFTNVHIDQNEILAEVDEQQKIRYDIELTPALQTSLTQKTSIISIELYPKPSYMHPQFDKFLTDTFEFKLYNQSDSNLFTFHVSDRTWSVTTDTQLASGTLPSSLTRFAWNTIQIVNYDVHNNNRVSIYWKFGTNQQVNLLENASINSFALESCIRYEFMTPIKDPYMYVENETLRRMQRDGIESIFYLKNAHLSYNVRNLQINVFTYRNDINVYDSETHNIIVGKDIAVQGINNICLGTNFATSGNRSIIIGNEIGGGELNTSSVNDIFQSIIIGNTSFRNSVVRDIICIGNDNFNGLSAEDVIKSQYFLAQKPIIIGNSVDISKIDYHINIGNVLLCTNVGSKQIYLGNNKEAVAVGYGSNELLSSTKHDLYVYGSVKASEITSSKYTKYGICTSYVPPYFVVKDTGSIDEDRIEIVDSTSNTLVYGIVHDSYMRPDGAYDVRVCFDGKTKVWCASSVIPGELLVSDSNGVVIGRGEDTRIHSFTFAKSLSSWDPNQTENTPLIETSNINNMTVGLISCVFL